MSRSAIDIIRESHAPHEPAIPAMPVSLKRQKEIDEREKRARRASRYHAAAGSFRSFGEQLDALMWAATPGAVDKARLKRTAGGAWEGDPSTGGYLVAPQFAQELIASVYEGSRIAKYCDRRPTANPLGSINLPAVDESSRADGSRWGGVTSAWANEADQYSASFFKARRITFAPKKVLAAMVVSAELGADVPALEAHIRKAFQEEFAFKLDTAVLKGTGAGQPLGILNAPATIQVPKEAGQTSATILHENVSKMFARLPAPCRDRAVWLVHEDAETQLSSMVVVSGTAGTSSPAAVMMYPPVPGPAVMKGRPIVWIEQASALGAVGDITLADLSAYVVIDGGIRPAISVDARFLNDEWVFRFTVRVDGAPAYASAITPYSGSTTKSPFVTLQAR